MFLILTNYILKPDDGKVVYEGTFLNWKVTVNFPVYI